MRRIRATNQLPIERCKRIVLHRFRRFLVSLTTGPSGWFVKKCILSMYLPVSVITFNFAFCANSGETMVICQLEPIIASTGWWCGIFFVHGWTVCPVVSLGPPKCNVLDSRIKWMLTLQDNLLQNQEMTMGKLEDKLCFTGRQSGVYKVGNRGKEKLRNPGLISEYAKEREDPGRNSEVYYR